VPSRTLPGFGTHTLAKGTTLHRFCAISRRPNVFNPCMGDATRFAPLYTRGATKVCIPTLYVGETYEAAAFGTIFRNLPPIPLSRQIRESDLHQRGYARLEWRRDLILGPFFHQNLSLIGQTRQSMIDTADISAYCCSLRPNLFAIFAVDGILRSISATHGTSPSTWMAASVGLETHQNNPQRKASYFASAHAHLYAAQNRSVV
jgi:hypothetical protein